MQSDDRAAVERWAARAEAEAESITLDDWARLWTSWNDVSPDAMYEVVAGLSDGELLRMRQSVGDDPAEPWAARVVVRELRAFVREEIAQRVLAEKAARVIETQELAVEALLDWQQREGGVPTQPASADTVETQAGWAFFNANGTSER